MRPFHAPISRYCRPLFPKYSRETCQVLTSAGSRRIKAISSGRLSPPGRPRERRPRAASRSSSLKPTDRARRPTPRGREWRSADHPDLGKPLGAVGQYKGRHVDLLGGLADQGDVDPLQVLARPVVDLRCRADWTWRLGGTGAALERGSEPKGGKHEKRSGRDSGTAVKSVLQYRQP